MDNLTSAINAALPGAALNNTTISHRQLKSGGPRQTETQSISDSVETGDREVDGRRAFSLPSETEDDSPVTGENLDLTG